MSNFTEEVHIKLIRILGEKMNFEDSESVGILSLFDRMWGERSVAIMIQDAAIFLDRHASKSIPRVDEVTPTILVPGYG